MTPNVILMNEPADTYRPAVKSSCQFDGAVLLRTGLVAAFAGRRGVVVAGNHPIFPVKDRNDITETPDVYVVVGRYAEDRGNYKVWDEGGIFPQVIFEVWSPNTRYTQVEDRLAFYEMYGAEEYYIVYPADPQFVEGWRRDGEKLVPVAGMNGFVSPRLGVRFELKCDRLTVSGPDGRPFRSPTELVAERDAATERASRLGAKLRELGGDPDAV